MARRYRVRREAGRWIVERRTGWLSRRLFGEQEWVLVSFPFPSWHEAMTDAAAQIDSDPLASPGGRLRRHAAHIGWRHSPDLYRKYGIHGADDRPMALVPVYDDEEVGRAWGIADDFLSARSSGLYRLGKEYTEAIAGRIENHVEQWMGQWFPEPHPLAADPFPDEVPEGLIQCPVCHNSFDVRSVRSWWTTHKEPPECLHEPARPGPKDPINYD